MSDENIVISVMRRLREVYLSVFVLFYRYFAGQWSATMNAHKGVAGVSIVQGVIVITLENWIGAFTGRRLELDRWVLWIVIVLIYAANYYFLVIGGTGVAFEKQFGTFPKSKQITLRLAAIGIFLATGIIFFFSAAAYHRALHVMPSG